MTDTRIYAAGTYSHPLPEAFSSLDRKYRGIHGHGDIYKVYLSLPLSIGKGVEALEVFLFDREVGTLEAFYRNPSISKNILEFAAENITAGSPSLLVGLLVIS